MEPGSRNGYPCYSPAEIGRRHDAVRGLMEKEGLHAVVVGGFTTALENSVQYFTNWAPADDSYVIFFPDDAPVIVARPWNHVPDAKRISVVDDVRYGGLSPEAEAETVGDLLAERRCTTIGLIGSVRHSQVQIMSSRVPDVTWRDAGSWYRRLRLIKSAEELAFIRIAAGLADKSIEAMARDLRPGLKEYEIVPIIEGAYLGLRGSNLIHFTLSTPMASPELCVPHQHQPDRELRPGDVVATEISVTYWGYSGQVLRSFTIASDPSPLYQELYDVASSVYFDIVKKIRPGVRLGDILDSAEMIEREGFTIWDALMHGWGGPGVLPPIVRTRQAGGATDSEDYVLQEGIVVVVQPNVITRDGTAGVQLGNAVHVGHDGAEVLHKYPMEFVRCG